MFEYEYEYHFIEYEYDFAIKLVGDSARSPVFAVNIYLTALPPPSHPRPPLPEYGARGSSVGLGFC